jgi:hypothetical protein
MSAARLPSAADFAARLGALLGRRVLARAQPHASVATAAIAVYRDDAGAALVVCAADLAFAAGSGAALAQILPAVAREQVEDGTVSGSIAENFHEVMNVCATLFNQPGLRHVRLREVEHSPPAAPKSAASLLPAVRQQLHLEVDVEGYGKGRLSMLAA